MKLCNQIALTVRSSNAFIFCLISCVTTSSLEGNRDGPEGRPRYAMNGFTNMPSPAVSELIDALILEYSTLKSLNTF